MKNAVRLVGRVVLPWFAPLTAWRMAFARSEIWPVVVSGIGRTRDLPELLGLGCSGSGSRQAVGLHLSMNCKELLVSY